MSFDYPVLLWAAPAFGLLIALIGWYGRRRRARAAAAWSPALGIRARRGWHGPWLLGLAAALAGVGLAGPRWGTVERETESRALNVVFAIDISRSMLAEDVAPNRLGRAVRETRRLLQDARGDRIALLAFAGRSYILTPLTLDEGAVELQLDALAPDVASEGGTDLATVLRQGRELLAAVNEGGARAMVLFTDGEAHDSLARVRDAAAALREAGVTLIVVGSGGVTPARIPIRDDNGVLLEYQKDEQGEEVGTARRDDVLRLVADAAQGIIVPADFADQAGAVWKTLATLDRASAIGRRTEDLVPRAWLFALGAFALILGQGAFRRQASLLAVGGFMVLTSAPELAAQRPAGGVRALGDRDTVRAIEIFRAAASAGRGADTSWYNGGSLALASGQLDLARKALGAAAGSLDPGVRFQALYNLGLAALLESRTNRPKRDELEREAAAHFRDALLLEPANASTKWNLELVSRRQPPTPPSSGGGQSQQPRGGGSGAGDPPQQPGVMSASEAEQILRSVERAEQSVRAEQLRRRRVARSASGKDW